MTACAVRQPAVYWGSLPNRLRPRSPAAPLAALPARTRSRTKVASHRGRLRTGHRSPRGRTVGGVVDGGGARAGVPPPPAGVPGIIRIMVAGRPQAPATSLRSQR
jgi:hypothetical protein